MEIDVSNIDYGEIYADIILVTKPLVDTSYL